MDLTSVTDWLLKAWTWMYTQIGNLFGTSSTTSQIILGVGLSVIIYFMWPEKKK